MVSRKIHIKSNEKGNTREAIKTKMNAQRQFRQKGGVKWFLLLCIPENLTLSFTYFVHENACVTVIEISTDQTKSENEILKMKNPKNAFR